MKYACLDNIIRSALLQTGKSLHFYIDALVYGREIVRELYFDDAQMVTPILLDVDTNTYAVNLPTDFVDFVSLCVRQGQMTRPLVQNNSINRLPNYNGAGQIVTYQSYPPVDTIAPSQSPLLVNVPVGLYWGTVTINDYGENIGRLFGWGGTGVGDDFIYLPERNQIQLNECIGYDKVELVYITDGTGCTAATMVDSYAQACITAYIKWQFKENSRTYGIGDKEWAKAEYTNQRSIYRARKDNMTIDDIKRVMQKNYYLAPHPY